jgi:acyl-[acyl-carrier-protein]-phospholipid O-acyltransferase/long-chain-fatty-acid--[acyl-carrier-protein] ligase
MTATQFLGAFNDNVFKQLVLLICVDYVALRGLDHDPYQTTAQGLFALPFVLFSGFAGWLSDRVSKRRIVVLCKAGEIGVMLAGLIGLMTGTMGEDGLLNALLAVLFVMGLQSAFFGPSKYGILPELFHEDDLPVANGVVQMTTFLAIIFGLAFCGFFKQWLTDAGHSLSYISMICIGIALIGTLTSLLVRTTPIARPGLPLQTSSFAIDARTWKMLWTDRPLLVVVLVSSLFWFLGGLLLPAINAYGKQQIGLDDFHTSFLNACVGFGIAAGCVLAGKLSRHTIRFGLVSRGAWGIVVTAALLSAVPFTTDDPRLAEALSAVLLTGLGVSAGFFAVPLQVFLQARPPKEQKGRMIGAMNLVNWIGILLAAGFYGLCSDWFTEVAKIKGGRPISHISWTFALVAGMLLPVALFYHPPDQPLRHDESSPGGVSREAIDPDG